MEDNIFNRKIDMENLNKIPVIETHLTYIKIAVDEIKETIKPVAGMKSDIAWLKFWHNKIVMGVILALVTGLGTLIFTLVVK